MLKEIIENNETKLGRWFDIFIQVLIVSSVICFSIETLPNLSSGSRDILRTFEVTAVLIFTAEYLARLLVSDSKIRFALSFFGVIDFLAILPFYISLGIDLRAIRTVRLIKVFRLFKLARYNQAIQRFYRAFAIAKEELVLFLGVTLILFYLSAVGIYFFENSAQPDKFSSVFESMWWAVITLTTVGYGDIYPVTVGGRIFTFVILLIGLGVVAVPTSIVASALARARQSDT